MNTGKPKRRIVIRNGTIVTMNTSRDIISADILIENDRILKIGQVPETTEFEIDARNQIIMPGFIQTHVHLCQALFRNQADDVSLIDWLQQYIWPMEAAHTAESIAISARLGLAEMLQCGTTTIMDFGTMRHTHVLFAEAEKAGISIEKNIELNSAPFIGEEKKLRQAFLNILIKSNPTQSIRRKIKMLAGIQNG